MSTKISDLHIAREDLLPAPRELHRDLPAGEAEAAHIAQARAAAQAILRGGDDRLLVIVGPCSIHEPESAIEYARRLREFSPDVADALNLVMRVYFEKPRTRMGWKGLIYDPDLDGRGDIGEGLRRARHILLEGARPRVPRAAPNAARVRPPARPGGVRNPRPGDAAVLRRTAQLGRHRRAHGGEPAAPADGIGAVGAGGL